MKRIALTDGSGKWFDAEKTEHFDESTEWDGSNNISKATGSQWEHEAIYRTAGGRWIKNSWSNYQGSTETYEEISAGEAAQWLSINGYEPHDSVKSEFAALEIA